MNTYKATPEQILQWGMKARRDFSGKSTEALEAVAVQCAMYEDKLREQADEVTENNFEKEELLRGSLRCTVRKAVANAMREGKIDADENNGEPQYSQEVLLEILQPVITMNEATPRKKI